MLNKIIKLSVITLMAIGLFASLPFTGYAYIAYISTGSATNVTATGATLHGTVNDSNLPVNTWFEYDKNINLASPTSISASSIGGGLNGNFSATLSGLNPNTTYYFRSVAQNTDGRAYGNILLFTTGYLNSPGNVNYVGNDTSSLMLTAKTEPANSISGTSVELNSLIYNEANDSSQTWFEWGTDASLGNKTTVVDTGIFTEVKHADTLKGLTPGKAYYFRAVAQNSSSINEGAILSFVTSNTINRNNVSKSEAATTNEPIDASSINTGLESIIGANVLGAGSFLPKNLFGWVLLTILVLLLILIGKHVILSFSRKEKKVVVNAHAPAPKTDTEEHL